MLFVPRLLSSARFLFSRFCLFVREICASTVRLSAVKIVDNQQQFRQVFRL
jgi:hypothetical protein